MKNFIEVKAEDNTIYAVNTQDISTFYWSKDLEETCIILRGSPRGSERVILTKETYAEIKKGIEASNH